MSHEPDGGKRWSDVVAEYAARLEGRLRAYDDAIARLESDAEALVFGEGEGRYRAASAAASSDLATFSEAPFDTTAATAAPPSACEPSALSASACISASTCADTSACTAASAALLRARL